MSCYLRVFGERFDVESYLKNSDFEFARHYIKGESKTPKTYPKKNIRLKSGLTITASDAEMEEFPKQIAESIQFLKTKKNAIKRLLSFPGVESKAILDFGIERRDVFGQFDYFPAELLLAAGQLGIGIGLSQYPAAMMDAPKSKSSTKAARKTVKKRK